MAPKKEFDFFDRPRNIRRLWFFLYALCGLTLVLELFKDRVPHFGLDGLFGFHALLGFSSCAVLILFSKIVGWVLKVKEDYYDR